ncbi:MAG TPA: LysR family transcriptional regulator [Candidatus Pristimantibacillus sp.]|nr:LysR family transcriptional regulator [Candidatus Pristimantibacillus sp.]
MEERLKKFAHLVDAGSFTKAAAGMHVSQPALSAAVAKLERELRSSLLVHGARPLALTPAGELAYQTAKDLSVQTDNLKLRLAELAERPVTLRIGMIDSIADTLFSHGAGLELAKDARISLVVNNSRYLTEAAERGEIDVAFVAKQQGKLPAILESRQVADEPLVIVARPLQHSGSGPTLSNFIAYDQASNTFRLVNQALKSYGVKPEISFYSTSPDVTLRLVLQNQGTAALPYLLVREHVANGELVCLGGKTPWIVPRPIIVLRRRDRELPAVLKQLTRQTGDILSSLASELES